MTHWQYCIVKTWTPPDTILLDHLAREDYTLISVIYVDNDGKYWSYFKKQVDEDVAQPQPYDLDEIPDFQPLPYEDDLMDFEDDLDSPGGVMRSRFWDEHGRYPEEGEV